MSDAITILYLVHDLSDPAVHKRVTMLQAGGATVVLAGFRRVAEPLQQVSGCITINLGRTYNGGFIQRLWAVLREALFWATYRWEFARVDIIIARNLEMLALGVRAKHLCADVPVLVYESLDIHRLLLGRGVIGKLLRKLEGQLSKRASLLITSSPAFVSEYFSALSEVRLPIRLVENKVYLPSKAHPLSPVRRPTGPPWKIGWFGAIRCLKSLVVLTELVRASQGKVEVIIRGRPAFDQFADFHQRVQGIPGLSFLGPYSHPDDLAAIYSEVHFSWAIDMFEEGLNSSWLLPNRIYEGGMYGAVPLALASIETGHFISKLGIGITLAPPLGASLQAFFQQLTQARYESLQEAVVKLPPSTWRCSKEDCQELVAYLCSLKNTAISGRSAHDH